MYFFFLKGFFRKGLNTKHGPPPQRKDVTPGMRLFEGNFAFHSERREKENKRGGGLNF